MRILVVGQFYPWPADSGARLRLANIIEALLPLGEVDLFVATRDKEHPTDLPADPRFHRATVAPVPIDPLSWGRRLTWLAGSQLPLELATRDFEAVRQAFSRFVQGVGYDLVWVSRLDTFVAVEPMLTSPTIVDIDDFRDDLTNLRFATYERDGQRTGISGLLKRFQTNRNASLWTRLRERTAKSVHAVVVCSDNDRVRLAASNVSVVPNGYDAPDRPVGKTVVGKPPTILLQGMLNYPPNVDGARFLVERVLPVVRNRVPDCRVRMVGRPAPAVTELGTQPGVVVTGRVPNMEVELERADLVAVPIRFGGGTRIKILEAFAHRIPVVSTSLGAYGLDVADGRHLRIADTPNDFADACTSLLVDEAARMTQVDQAEALFLKSYQWCNIANSIRELALDVTRASDVDNKGNDALAC